MTTELNTVENVIPISETTTEEQVNPSEQTAEPIVNPGEQIREQNTDSVAQPEAKRFICHIRQYPLLMAAKQEISKLPYVAETTTTIVPLIRSAEMSLHLDFVCTHLDTSADLVLTQVDRVAPFLKTTQVEDIVEPIKKPMVQAVASTQHLAKTTEILWDQNVTQPTNKMVQEIDSVCRHVFYDSNGKNIALSPVDPLVRPINDIMLSMILWCKPHMRQVDSNSVSSEIARAKHIMWNFVTGAKEPIESNVAASTN